MSSGWAPMARTFMDWWIVGWLDEWMGGLMDRLLEHAVAVEYGAQRVAAQQVSARMIFLGDFLLRAGERFVLQRAGDDDHAVEVREDEFSRLHQHLAAAHLHVVGHHASSSHAVERTNARKEHRKFHRHDFAAITNVAVADATRRAVAFG